jgi:hypothetical protein
MDHSRLRHGVRLHLVAWGQIGREETMHLVFTLIHQRGKFLGYVEAPDQESAIKEAIKHFEIKDPEE